MSLRYLTFMEVVSVILFAIEIPSVQYQPFHLQLVLEEPGNSFT